MYMYVITFGLTSDIFLKVDSSEGVRVHNPPVVMILNNIVREFCPIETQIRRHPQLKG